MGPGGLMQSLCLSACPILIDKPLMLIVITELSWGVGAELCCAGVRGEGGDGRPSWLRYSRYKLVSPKQRLGGGRGDQRLLPVSCGLSAVILPHLQHGAS